MARTAVPDSATSQFFVNLKDNRFLDKAKAPNNAGYAVFGKVIDGMDVVDNMSRVKTGMRGGHADVPLETIVIKSIRRDMEFTLTSSGSLVAGKPITVMARVDFPSKGQALTLELPTGLRCVEGKEIQPVPLTSGPTLVLWRIQAAEPGEYTVNVRSNLGITRTQTLKIARRE